MANQNFRINTTIGQDKVIRVKVGQDFDNLEILSLKIGQTDTYKLHTAQYGMVVGRVLANEAFGIPNAKVSIFVPISDEDEMNSTLRDLYNYTSVNDSKNNIRYNLLPDEYSDDCKKVIGTFPSKRLVLDNDTQIEIFDKYWKYTTVTNSAGDYVIFGVPIGIQQLHVDIDLSDIGILSQKPRDFMYKGYNLTLFDNAEQFKDGTNLDNLAQVISQNQPVHIYPFWGDSDMGEIAISRCDIAVHYKFEPTCVFFGSIVTDDYSNAIGEECSPSQGIGKNKNLVTSEGTIEMIRMTSDGLVEEFPIMGNRLIDGDGVWCYQIPMNLDYVVTDEYGQIVPTDSPNKGIPTRTRVRFRMSVSETTNEGIGRHRAKFLVPNNPILNEEPLPHVANFDEFSKWMEFGSATNKNDFRDLYWNNIYSIKSYIPRIQKHSSRDSRAYTSLRSTNWTEGQNPIPFNTIRLRLPFGYRLLCLLITIVAGMVEFLNGFFSILTEVIIIGFRIPVIDWGFYWAPLCNALKCMKLDLGIDEYNEEGKKIVYYPGCKGDKNCLRDKASKDNDGAEVKVAVRDLTDSIQTELAEDYEIVHLDFSNDWINGVLYFPLWFWKKQKKLKYLFGLFSLGAVNRYCSCNTKQNKLFLSWPCSLSKGDLSHGGGDNNPHRPNQRENSPKIPYGVIQEHTNRAGLNIYYYSPGVVYNKEKRDTQFTRLFATDIILLGSFNNCSLNPVPALYKNLPSTTSNVPPIRFSYLFDNDDEDKIITPNNKGALLESGMDVLNKARDDMPRYRKGLFYDVGCNSVTTYTKTCVNASRMCELGVVGDAYHIENYPTSNNNINEWEIFADGMITRFELSDNESRAMFASMNHLGLNEVTINPQTNYRMHKMEYLYPMDFDGKLSAIAPEYTSRMKIKTNDVKDEAYIRFRTGDVVHNYDNGNDSIVGQVLYNNSFYFYFGLRDGSTAINKLLKNYASDCYKKTIDYIKYDIETSATTWCNDALYTSNVTSNFAYLAWVKFNFDRINTPYTIKIINEYENELKQLDNDSKEGDYYVRSGNEINGAIINGNSFEDDEICITNLHNGKYRIKITDSLGREVKQSIILIPSSINATISSQPLGIKYYSDTTVKTVVCKNGNYGEALIEDINLYDGKFYVNYVQNYQNKPNEYELHAVLSTDSSIIRKVHMKVEVNALLDDNTSEIPEYQECSCVNTPIKDVRIIDYNEHRCCSISVWKPLSLTITLTELCNGLLSRNTTSFSTAIVNGQEFVGLINDAPTEMIYKSPHYIANKMEWWVNANNPSYWKYFDTNEKLNDKNIAHYENYVNGIDIIETTKEGSLVPIISSTFNSNLEVIKFKFDSLFNVISECFLQNDRSGNFTFSTNGGKYVLINSNTPNYNLPTEEILSVNDKIYKKITISRDTSVDCEDNYPNIVFKNYTYPLDNDYHIKKVINYDGIASNIKYQDYKNLGNYFAAFTFQDNPNMFGGVEPRRVPENSKHIIDSISAPSDKSTTYNSEAVNNFFDAQFVDRRLDYSIFLFEPLLVGDKEYGGFLSATTYNGVEMIYDDKHNILSHPTKDVTKTDQRTWNEYFYNVDGTYNDEKGSVEMNDSDTLDIYLNTNKSKETMLKRQYYSSSIKFGYSKYDTRTLYGKGYEVDGWQDINTLLNETDELSHIDCVRRLGTSNIWGDGSNKAIERTLTFKNVPLCSKIEYEVSSCSLKPEVTIESYLSDKDKMEGNYEKYSKRIKATISGGQSLSAKITLGQTLSLTNNRVSDVVDDINASNIIFIQKSYYKDERDDYLMTVNAYSWIYDLRINNTSSNSNYYTYIPCAVKNISSIYTELYDNYDGVFEKCGRYGGDSIDVKRKIDELLENNTIQLNVDEDSLKNVDGEIIESKDNAYLNGCTLQSFKWNERSKKLYKSIGKNNIPFWDNESSGVRFSGQALIGQQDGWKQANEISILTIRHYFNQNQQNLLEEVLTYNFNYTVDVNAFEIEMFDTWLVGDDSYDTSQEEHTMQMFGFYIYSKPNGRGNSMLDVEELNCSARMNFKIGDYGWKTVVGENYNPVKSSVCDIERVVRGDKYTYTKITSLTPNVSEDETAEGETTIKSYPKSEFTNTFNSHDKGFRVVVGFSSNYTKVNLLPQETDIFSLYMVLGLQGINKTIFSTVLRFYNSGDPLKRARFRKFKE